MLVAACYLLVLRLLRPPSTICMTADSLLAPTFLLLPPSILLKATTEEIRNHHTPLRLLLLNFLVL